MAEIDIQKVAAVNHSKLNKKKCLSYIFCVAFLEFICIFAFNDKAYLFISISVACLIIAWFAYLLFSKRRTLSEYKLLSDGFLLAYMSLQFMYVCYAIIAAEKKPFVLLLFFMAWIFCFCVSLRIVKNRALKETKKYSKMWDCITIPVIVLGYYGAKSFFPRLEYENIVYIGIIMSSLCSVIMCYFCSRQLFKAVLICKMKSTGMALPDT